MFKLCVLHPQTVEAFSKGETAHDGMAKESHIISQRLFNLSRDQIGVAD